LKNNDFLIKVLYRKPLEEIDGKPTYYPIYQTASYFYESAEALQESFTGKRLGNIYSRISNPTVTDFEKILKEMDNGIGAIATASGMSAISLVTLSLIGNKRKIIVQRGIFSGTLSLFQKTLSPLGIVTELLETDETQEIIDKIDNDTAFVFLETIGNPMLNVLEIDKIGAVCKEKAVPLILDNTVLPYLFSPKNCNVSISLYSTTKFISGMSTSVGGAMVDLGTFDWNNEKFPELKKLYKKFKNFAFIAKARSVLRDLGFIQTPFNAFLQTIGIETLPLRIERQCKNALKLAKFLSEQKNIITVSYPGLPSSQYFQVAKRLFKKHFGAILTFELKNKQMAFNFIDSLKHAKNLANIGDIRTLVIHPASTIFSDFSEQEKVRHGVTEGLIRVSVGIENIENIIEDFKEALNKL